MKLYALCTLHEVNFFHLAFLSVFNSYFHHSQTGWGTRTGIGDAAAATAALERQNNEKNNNPYQQQPYSATNNTPYPFQFSNDHPPSPYHDEPMTNTPVYASRHTPRMRSLSSRRKPKEDEGGVEMQTALAR